MTNETGYTRNPLNQWSPETAEEAATNARLQDLIAAAASTVTVHCGEVPA